MIVFVIVRSLHTSGPRCAAICSWALDKPDVAHLALLLIVTGRAPESGDGADTVHCFGELCAHRSRLTDCNAG